MTITSWPNYDRPREKLLARGEQALTDAELIAIFLRTGTRGKTAVDIARQLLADFGGIKNLMQAPFITLTNLHGIGASKYASLKAALELGRRCLTHQAEHGDTLNSSSKTRQFIADHLRHHASEVFACIFMDMHYRLIRFDELFYGSIHEAVVYPREIVRRGLLYNAARIILAHNHPSGIALPSEADKTVTSNIKQALALVDMKLIDHIIVGRQDTYSFAEDGLV
ncbi:MAG TPA: DNA repair protein RadC [Gammaproteobacteria bacterium]|jgi:DNA repair protein RadC|nr:DNA repair protein RadC [Gammaproteobacteria bacterium]